MTERFLSHLPLGVIVQEVEQIINPGDGFYVLHVPIEGDIIDENTECFIILSYHIEDEKFMSLFAEKHGLNPYCEVSFAQHIVQAAKQEKPNILPADLVRALEFYIEHDAFMHFD